MNAQQSEREKLDNLVKATVLSVKNASDLYGKSAARASAELAHQRALSHANSMVKRRHMKRSKPKAKKSKKAHK